MADASTDDFSKEIAAAFADEEITENPVTPASEEPKKDDPTSTPPAKVEEPKKDDPEKPTDQNKEDEKPKPTAANPEKPTEEDPAKPETPAAPPAADEPKPLTEEGVLRILNQARNEERTSSQILNNTYQEVIDAYYPDGLSNTLVDETSGKELRTPQDVVDASGGQMSIEEATRWLMNEQYKLDQNIDNIKRQAAQIAETTVNFKRDSIAVIQKYEPLFKAYPKLQEKAFNLMMKQVRVDQNKGVILSAPDVMELYDTYLEPYQMAYEHSTQNPATNPVSTPAATETPKPATPTIDDRLDDIGDGGDSPVDDPTNFAQQVIKELAKGA